MSALAVIFILLEQFPYHKKSSRIPEGAVVVATPLNSSFDRDMAAKEVRPSEFGLKILADVEVLQQAATGSQLFVERQLNLWTMCCCLCNDKAWSGVSYQLHQLTNPSPGTFVCSNSFRSTPSVVDVFTT